MELVLGKWICAFLLCSWLIFSGVYSVVGLHGDSKVRAVNLGGWLVVEGWIKPSLFDGIPNGDMLDGTVVQLKSVTLDKYVSAENGGGANVSVSRDVASSWETLRLWRVSKSEFQFRTSLGQFLTCDGADGCSVSATAVSPSTSETFYVERNNNRMVHIKTMSGMYLQLANGYGHNKAKDVLKILLHHLLVELWKLLIMHSHGHSRSYNIRCIIDLHAAPGSQNRMEHSASRDGSTDWPTPDSISQTLHVIDFLISRYARQPALLGIELLNEPSAATVPLDTLVSYYKQGYQVVRKHSSTAYVIICQRIGNADPLELFQANIGSHKIVVDLHYYNLFDNFFFNMSPTDNIQFIYKNRETQLQALNSANGPLVFIGEWVNEWNATSASQTDYQDFGRVQLEVYSAASFGWAYWTLKNDRPHWDFEWNIRNNYLQLSSSPNIRSFKGLVLLVLLFYLHHIL